MIYDRAQIMRTAHRAYRHFGGERTWSHCLRAAWAQAKRERRVAEIRTMHLSQYERGLISVCAMVSTRAAAGAWCRI